MQGTDPAGRLLVKIVDGRLHDERGNPIDISYGVTLMGWGDLDGPSYCLQPEGCAWYVNANRRQLDAWAKRHGVTISVGDA